MYNIYSGSHFSFVYPKQKSFAQIHYNIKSLFKCWKLHLYNLYLRHSKDHHFMRKYCSGFSKTLLTHMRDCWMLLSSQRWICVFYQRPFRAFGIFPHAGWCFGLHLWSTEWIDWLIILPNVVSLNCSSALSVSNWCLHRPGVNPVQTRLIPAKQGCENWNNIIYFILFYYYYFSSSCGFWMQLL